MIHAHATARVGARLDDREALHEMLVASVTLSMQIEEPDVAEQILEALRCLHRDEPVAIDDEEDAALADTGEQHALEGEDNVGFT